jgi:uncharacterized protein YneR
MQQQLSKGKLLNEKGDLLEKGYAFSLVKDYSRDQIKAPKFRIKEWDYYYFGNFEVSVKYRPRIFKFPGLCDNPPDVRN